MAVSYFVDSLLSCCLLCDPPTIWIELKPSHCTAGHRELTSTHHQTLATTLSTFGGDKAQEIRQSSEVAGTVLPSLVSALPFGRLLIEPSQTKCVWDSRHPAPVRLCPGQTSSPAPGRPRGLGPYRWAQACGGLRATLAIATGAQPVGLPPAGQLPAETRGFQKPLGRHHRAAVLSSFDTSMPRTEPIPLQTLDSLASQRNKTGVPRAEPSTARSFFSTSRSFLPELAG